jgi:phage terminase small subunit
MAEHAERVELTADWVIDELRKIAAANLADYVSKTSDGDPYLDFSALTRDQTAALFGSDRRRFCRRPRRGCARG